MGAARSVVAARMRGLEAELDAARRAITGLEAEVTRRDALIEAARAGTDAGGGAAARAHDAAAAAAARIAVLEAEALAAERVMREAENVLRALLTVRRGSSSGGGASALSLSLGSGGGGRESCDSSATERRGRSSSAVTGAQGDGTRSPSFGDLLAVGGYGGAPPPPLRPSADAHGPAGCRSVLDTSSAEGESHSRRGSEASHGMDGEVNLGSVVAPSVASHDLHSYHHHHHHHAMATAATAGMGVDTAGMQMLPRSPRAAHPRESLHALLARISGFSRFVSAGAEPGGPHTGANMSSTVPVSSAADVDSGAWDLEQRLSSISEALGSYASAGGMSA